MRPEEATQVAGTPDKYSVPHVRKAMDECDLMAKKCQARRPDLAKHWFERRDKLERYLRGLNEGSQG